MALRAAGICRGGVNWANYFVWQKTLGQFETWVNDQYNKGLRLIDVETYVVNGQRRWAGVVRSGNWKQKFVHSIEIAAFPQQLTDPANQGLAPFNFEIYVDGGKVYIAAILRSGLLTPNGPALVLAVDSPTLKTANQQHINQGRRLVDIETYVSGGKRWWAAFWLPGD